MADLGRSHGVQIGSSNYPVRNPGSIYYLNYWLSTARMPLALADLNSDGHLDVIVDMTQKDSNYLSILLGDGTGALAAPRNFPSGAVASQYNDVEIAEENHAIVVADFNHDTFLDIAIVKNDGVRVFAGDGTGNLGPATLIPIGGVPYSLAIGDLNRDGHPDIVVGSGSRFGTVGNGSDLSVLLGNGSGGFDSPLTLELTATGMHVMLADLNGDGNLDIVALEEEPDVSAIYASRIHIFYGDGAGNLSLPTVVMIDKGRPNFGVRGFALADLTGDGQLDLIISPVYGFANGLYVMPGECGGTFHQGSFYPFGGGAGLAVGDLKHDGRPDVVEANGRGQPNVSVFLGGRAF
jgi:hypothetical protein